MIKIESLKRKLESIKLRKREYKKVQIQKVKNKNKLSTLPNLIKTIIF